MSAPARILVVEDDYLVAMELEYYLQQAAFEVVGVASNADDAIRLAERARPHLAIMDIRLAGRRDGIDAAIELARDLGIRSIFATAHSDTGTRQRAAAAQPLGWVQKPYTPAALIAAIRAALPGAAD